jgi:hypothetical protein
MQALICTCSPMDAAYAERAPWLRHNAGESAKNFRRNRHTMRQEDTVPDLKQVATALQQCLADKHYRMDAEGQKLWADQLEAALYEADKRTEYIVAVGDGTFRKVKGYIVGPFGVGKCSYGSSVTWSITHLKTGLRVRAYVPKLKDARALAEKWATLTDWDAITADNSKDYLTPEIVAALKAA